MNTAMKRLGLLVMTLLTTLCCYAQADIVKSFYNNVGKYCSGNEASAIDEAGKLVYAKCKFDDAITDKLGQGVGNMDHWMRYFIDRKRTLKFALNSVDYLYDEPSVTKPGKWYKAVYTITEAGKTMQFEDCVRVNDNKIYYVNKSGSELQEALQLYKDKKYDDAFRLFRKLAYSEFDQTDAQYYESVMVVKNQGGKFLSKETRLKEATWWCYKGVASNHSALSKMAETFFIDGRHLPDPYKGLAKFNYNFNLWGYNKWDYVLLSPPYSHGLMISVQNGKYGYCDESGALVIPYKFSYAENFSSNGLALVKVKDKYGFIDTKGNFVIEPKYKEAHSFIPQLGIAIVCTDSYRRDDRYFYKILAIDRRGDIKSETERKGHDSSLGLCTFKYVDSGYYLLSPTNLSLEKGTCGETTIEPDGTIIFDKEGKYTDKIKWYPH